MTRLTPAVEKAIKKAAYLHHDQIRLTDENIPYISHILSVALLITGYTDDEDTLVASILHDTIEDTDYTYEELEQDFGPNVREIVEGVTEVREKDGKCLPWLERKKSILQKLQTSSNQSKLVCIADKIHNLNCLLSDYDKYGEVLWDILSPGPREKLWYHKEVISILEQQMGGSPALNELKQVYNRCELVFSIDKPTEKTLIDG
jgi:(p)ppGpp synthase/HD superfamily hydrolase